MNALPPLPWLVADIGGTNTRFALVTTGDAVPESVRILRCADYPAPADAIEHYLGIVNAPRPQAAVLAIAGPVTGDRVAMTNHPWTFSAEELRRRLGLERLRVLNDFTALALALPHLAADDYRRIGAGDPVPGEPLALLGPGTGLGVSGLLPCADGRWLPLAGEGGHVTLPTNSPREAAVIDIVRCSHAHVSAERLLSGSGLVTLYQAIAELDGHQAEPLTPAAISEQGLAGRCPLCLDTLNLFCGLLGGVAGNLVLTLGARGGVYIGGGIVSRLGEFFDHSPFRHGFTAKGRYRDYLATIPSYVITAETPALLGAARAFSMLPE